MLRWLASLLGRVAGWFGCCCRCAGGSEDSAAKPPKREASAFTMHGLEDRQHLSISGLVSVSINDVAVLEGNTGQRYAVFTVALSALSTKSVTVHYATADGTAKAGSDYQAVSGSLIFPVGTRSRTIAVPILGDTVQEADETFTVKLTSPIGVPIAREVGTCLIVDDDRPVITIAAAGDASEAGTAGIFRIARTGPTTTDLKVRYAIAGTATNGTDYAKLSGVALIKAGQASVDVKVTPVRDSLQEGDETVVLKLKADAAYLLGNTTSATLKITDREAVPPKATLTAKPVRVGGAAFYQFSVKYTDNVAMDLATAGDGDVRVTGPNRFAQNGVLVSAKLSRDKKALVAVYRIPAPGGSWDRSDNGAYTISIRPNQIADAAGNPIAAGGLGTFVVSIP